MKIKKSDWWYIISLILIFATIVMMIFSAYKISIHH
jgi:hypothetical protein